MARFSFVEVNFREKRKGEKVPPARCFGWDLLAMRELLL